MFPYLADGAIGWTMYFSAVHGGQRCLGTAKAPSPDGLFVATSQMWCPDSSHEAIDPALVIANNRRYVVFKTSIVNQSDFDIVTLPMHGKAGTAFGKGAPTSLFPEGADYDLTENPDLAFHDGTFWLFLSRRLWTTCDYYTDAWSAKSFPPKHGFKPRKTIADRNLTRAASGRRGKGLCGPGGMSIFQDNGVDRVILHAWKKNPAKDDHDRRDAWLGTLRWTDGAGLPYID